MKSEAKSQLKKILGDYDEKLAEAERLDAANCAAHAAFPGRFVTLKTETIQPAIQEIADMLNEGGHKASVREQEESSSGEGGVKFAAVSLRIVPKPFTHKSAETNPVAIEITFSARLECDARSSTFKLAGAAWERWATYAEGHPWTCRRPMRQPAAYSPLNHFASVFASTSSASAVRVL